MAKINYFIASILLYSCSPRVQKLSIIPLTMLNYERSDTISDKTYKYKGEYFLVKGYKDNTYCDNYIDSFVNKNADTGFLERGTHYRIVFYKESSETNVENILKNPRIIDRYSQDHDKIFDYGWQKGMHGKEKIRNGEVVNQKPLKVEIKEIKD